MADENIDFDLSQSLFEFLTEDFDHDQKESSATQLLSISTQQLVGIKDDTQGIYILQCNENSTH